MSVQYRAVGWNRQKRLYDISAVAGILLYLAAFIGLGGLLNPSATAETLVIRGFGTLAFLLLHLILAIGPLSRLDRRFLPLLYNRRHLGVMMFLAALVHGAFSIVQFHALGDINPLVSVFVSNTRFSSLPDFPFQAFGFFALVILFLMAATSHDFWLHNLSAPVWKRLHMMVYAAYALLVAHVVLGALQDPGNDGLAVLVGVGMTALAALHIKAGSGERRLDDLAAKMSDEGFIQVCRVDEIPEKRARIVTANGERIAVFRYDGKISAISNVCRHQNGPLGEGRIVDGCITCPWHGYQYVPDSGTSPPPFTDKVATFQTRVAGGMVLVDPNPQKPGTRLAPALIDGAGHAQ